MATTSGERDQRLGPWGLYSVEGTNRVGLAKALRDTANHLEHGLAHIRSMQTRTEAAREIDRLRAEAYRAEREAA